MACEILTDQFGDVVGKVGNTLAQHGPQTMDELIQGTMLQYAQVRNALLVLIQHNMCIYYDKNIFLQRLDQGGRVNEEEEDMKTETEKQREQEERREKWKHKGGGGETGVAPTSSEEVESEAIILEKQKQFEKQSKIIYYQIIIDNVVMRLKSAKFLYVVKSKYGSDAEELLHVLLQNGRLTMQDLIQKSLESICTSSQQGKFYELYC